jgi:hypothetical protein
MSKAVGALIAASREDALAWSWCQKKMKRKGDGEMGEIVSAASRTALNRHRRESSRSCTLLFDGFSNQNSNSSYQALANDS